MRRLRSRRAIAVSVAVAIVAIVGAVPAAGAGNHAPDAPTGTPQFGWRVTDADENEIQTAYELVVRTNKRVVLDTQKVTSSQQAYIEPPTLRLQPDTSYTWTVRTWDRTGAAGPYAPPARFDMGLGDHDWHASWIRREGSETGTEDDFSLFRKDVALAATPIARARVYASAGQQYELFVNGKLRTHGPSFSYPDEQYYDATDVTHSLRAGASNAFAFVTHWSTPGQGRPASVPALIAHITIDHTDGTRDVITTDSSWKTHPGPWIQGSRRNSEGDFV